MARLICVSVGIPRDIEWHGRTVHTGIWKEPVQGRRRVKRLNVDGDGQGDLDGHGGEQRAVFVYQLESYRYWEKQLGRSDFMHGQFRRELHRRRVAGRRGLHRRPLPDRDRAVRGDPAPDHLLPRRDSDERAADGRASDLQRTAGLLPARARGRRGRRRRPDRADRSRTGAHDRRRGQCAAVFASSSPRSARAGAANPCAVPGVAMVVRGVAAKPGCPPWRDRQRGSGAGSGCADGSAWISAAASFADRS